MRFRARGACFLLQDIPPTKASNPAADPYTSVVIEEYRKIDRQQASGAGADLREAAGHPAGLAAGGGREHGVPLREEEPLPRLSSPSHPALGSRRRIHPCAALTVPISPFPWLQRKALDDLIGLQSRVEQLQNLNQRQRENAAVLDRSGPAKGGTAFLSPSPAAAAAGGGEGGGPRLTRVSGRAPEAEADEAAPPEDPVGGLPGVLASPAGVHAS